jgi:hypothetical protein
MNLPATQDSATPAVAQGPFDVLPSNFESYLKAAEIISKTDLVPKEYVGNPNKILVAMQFGAELGLKPLQAVQNIAVINGRPSIWGDIALAMVRNHHDFESYNEFLEGTGDSMKGVAIIKRRSSAIEKRQEFSIADAKAAGLYGKTGPWTQYQPRMLKLRARAFLLRDECGDILRGLSIAEESRDIEVTDFHYATPTQTPTVVSPEKGQAVKEKIGKTLRKLKTISAPTPVEQPKPVEPVAEPPKESPEATSSGETGEGVQGESSITPGAQALEDPPAPTPEPMESESKGTLADQIFFMKGRLAKFATGTVLDNTIQADLGIDPGFPMPEHLHEKYLQALTEITQRMENAKGDNPPRTVRQKR